MPKNPNAPKPEETFQFFQTAEPFKALSGRLGISPNTLRKWWVGEFGQEAFDARGKAIQAKAAADTGRATAGKPRTITEVVEPCVSCQASVTLNVLQRSMLNRILCQACDGRERGADRYCPVCGLGCVGKKGLSGHMARPQHGDPEAHRAYLVAQEAAEWAGKQEGRDYVSCLICGHRGVRIDPHVQAAHALAVEAYRAKFPGAEVQADILRAGRGTALRQRHHKNPWAGQTRVVACTSCNADRTVGLTFAPSLHETRCSECVGAEKALREPKVRAPSPLKGRTLSPETKAKMSLNAGRWNAGSTKDTDTRVWTTAQKLKGRISWSKGLTKVEHPSLRATAEKLSRWSGEKRYWSNGLRVDLSDVDFTPYLDETGAVDRRLMAEELGLSEPTITKYMDLVGLRLSTKYVAANAERRVIRLAEADLERFRLANGKVLVAAAMVGLGHGFAVIKRECLRHGLETFHHRVRQTICLDAISQALGGASYEQEWSPRRFTNPATGHRFRFDGYFSSHNLVTEFHGYQHWTFPSVYIKDEARYFALQERDRIKENLIHADPMLRYFLVREDEPYADPEYLRGRLLDEGFVDT